MIIQHCHIFRKSGMLEGLAGGVDVGVGIVVSLLCPFVCECVGHILE